MTVTEDPRSAESSEHLAGKDSEQEPIFVGTINRKSFEARRRDSGVKRLLAGARQAWAELHEREHADERLASNT